MDVSLGGLAASLLFNVALPALWLTVLSKHVEWGPMPELCVGLAFPLAYGLTQAISKRKFSALSALSLVSILLTAAVGFFAASRLWFAVKGAAVPTLVSAGIFIQRRRVARFLEDFIAKGPLLNGGAIAARLDTPAARAAYERILGATTFGFSLHFLLNAALNGAWNWLLVTADPGTTLFNEQYGVLLARNLYLVALPCAVSILTIVAVTGARLRALTGLTWRELAPPQ